ncbi:nucleotidyltransferase family protein [Rhodopila sp.]|uniref:nucleotidyltransferase family protein n=1 Tax=Rhodopila sp. TaxID=2480087 RepID=UPI003D0F4C18
MAGALPIDIRPDLWRNVRDILTRHVCGHEVWAFGSRAMGKAKPYSDLDPAIITDTPLPLLISARLADDFPPDDSRRAEVVDRAATQTAFREIIERDKVALQRRGGGNPDDAAHVSQP